MPRKAASQSPQQTEHVSKKGKAIAAKLTAARLATGRPTDYTDDLGAFIGDKIAQGWSLKRICDLPDMPEMASVFLWLHRVPSFSEIYARAKQAQADYFAEELTHLADTAATKDTQRARLMVDTRKWLMSKFKPGRYADRIEQVHDVKGTLADLLGDVDGKSKGL